MSVPSRELRRLVADLPDQGLVVHYGASDAGAVAADIAAARPRSRVVAVAANVVDAGAARLRLSGLPNAEVVTGDSLDALGEQAPAAVVLKPSGFEGMHVLRSMLADARRALRVGGRCYLVVHTRRGAARLTEMLDELFGDHDVLKGGGMRVLAATKAGSADDAPEPVRSEVRFQDQARSYTFATGTALFSRERVDLGARLLLETVRPAAGGTLVDLGCGYGVLGVVLAGRDPASRVVMVDADSRAVRAARENAARNGVRVEVVLADGLGGLGLVADDVVTNFPLHIARDVQRRLLAECRDSLRRGGRLWLCALAQYDLGPLVEEAFGNVRVQADTIDREDPGERYRVLLASRPSRGFA